MGGKRNNKSSQGKVDTSKISNVVPYRTATLEEATAPIPEPAFIPKPEKEPAMSQPNPIINAIFGDTSIGNLMALATVNSFYDTPRYIAFKRFYQQNPDALMGVVRKCFESWKTGKYSIELDILDQNNLYIKDANQFKIPRREDDTSSLLTHVAYTLFARNEAELTATLTDVEDDGRGILEIAETTLRGENVDTMENVEFARFWRDVAYS